MFRTKEGNNHKPCAYTQIIPNIHMFYSFDTLIFLKKDKAKRPPRRCHVSQTISNQLGKRDSTVPEDPCGTYCLHQNVHTPRGGSSRKEFRRSSGKGAQSIRHDDAWLIVSSTHIQVNKTSKIVMG